MFDIYLNCEFQNLKQSNGILEILVSLATIVALIISIFNFIIIKRNQKIETHIDILNLQKDVDDKQIEFSKINSEYNNLTTSYINSIIYANKLDDSFRHYISSVERLATLLNTTYVNKQYFKKNWSEEYKEMFNDAKNIYDNYPNNILKSRISIKNINKKLNAWI
jgi:hypothetical protein